MFREFSAALLIVCGATLQFALAQDEPLSRENRGAAKEMLHDIEIDIKEHYFDKKYQGLDVDARFKEAEKKIETAQSMNYALADIAAAVDALNDSHTFFIPPSRPYKHSYGWEMQAIGSSDCFVTAVRPGSDAEKKGLKPGDQILSVNGHEADRGDIRKIKFVYNSLRPQLGLRIVARSPDGTTKKIDVMASMRPKERITDLDYWYFVKEARDAERVHRSHFVEYGNNVIIWKLPDFVFPTDQAKKMLDQIREYKAVILDLRGNPGGSIDFLLHFLGGVFDHEVKIGDRRTRDGVKPQLTKSRGDKTFNGKLVVLIDSESASASEIFARVVQLEKRGTVVGDLSSGSVMESRIYSHNRGMMVMTFYAASITEAAITMSDGNSLEHVGVVPDARIAPSAVDLAAGRDPALAYAAGLVGLELTPEKASTIFPVEWPSQ
jgi:C-terminal processing protease CtpA/Prc